MGFGSDDESGRETQQLDIEVDAGDGTRRPDHDGENEFEYDEATSDDLLATDEELTGS